jgi:hypothetical protein
MKTMKLVIGLIFLNLGVFFITAAFLPRASNYGYTNILEQFINARVAWDIAWVATIGSSLLSTGLVLLTQRSDRDDSNRGAA